MLATTLDARPGSANVRVRRDSGRRAAAPSPLGFNTAGDARVFVDVWKTDVRDAMNDNS